MKEIESELDRLAENLPDGYMVQICIKRGASWLQVIMTTGEVIRLDGDSETCWAMLMGDALGFCLFDSGEF